MIPKLLTIVVIAGVLTWMLQPSVSRLLTRYEDEANTVIRPVSQGQWQPYPVTPPPTPEPTPAPPRQFGVGDTVRWLIGGGGIAQGVIESYRLGAAGYWVYDVMRDSGHPWVGLEENRMTLVVDGVSLPFQPHVKGLMVMYFDMGTHQELGRGLVVGVTKHPNGPSYQVLQDDCTVHDTPVAPGRVRTVLTDEGPNTFGCYIPHEEEKP
jgi:hypothetical protein